MYGLVSIMSQNTFAKQNPLFQLMQDSGHSVEDLLPAFPGMSPSQVTQVLVDNRFGTRRSVERFGYLGIRECSSRYFNVDKNGRRLNGQESSSSNAGYQIHCYGGSTTLGQNVADNQTISTYLEIQLRQNYKAEVTVSNYGAGNHTSLHSSLRLLDHALSGRAPNCAIFLNGFNDCFYAAGGADGIVPFLDDVLFKSQDSLLNQSRLVDLTANIPDTRNALKNFNIDDKISDEQLLRNIKIRYQTSVAIQNFVEKYFNVKILRFIEPTSFVNCKPEQYLLTNIGSGSNRLKMIAKLYKKIEKQGCAKTFGTKNLTSLLDSGQVSLKFPLYVDEVHFSPAFNEHIARQIVGNSKFLGRARVKKVTKNVSELRPEMADTIDPRNYPLF